MAAQITDLENCWQGNLQLQPSPSPSPGSCTPSTRSRTPTTAYAVSRSGIVVFSGGSAANSLVDLFNQVREANNTTLSYVIPISDNGGSSSELIRVFGGPGMLLLSLIIT